MNDKSVIARKTLNANYAIDVQDVDKSFQIPGERVTNFKSYFTNPLKLFKKDERRLDALSDITFQVEKGEFVGIIGINGSGKSTLLKLIAGIYLPDKGRIKINGKLVPFLELGVGFNPELSAQENIFLNGTILGMTRKFLKRKLQEIVEFAEIEKFINTPIKNFSSGMIIRLAFSIAIQAKADIYLLDEVFAVGDPSFRLKSLTRLQQLMAEGVTMILVSHDFEQLAEYSTRIIMIDKGRILADGRPNEIIGIFNKKMNRN